MAHLTLPSEEYKSSFLAAAEELLVDGDGDRREAQVTHETFSDYLAYLETCRTGQNLTPGLVPDTVYWLVEGNECIGRVSIRHYLNEDLEKYGGHIGYLIRPSKRNMGYGSQILTLALDKARAMKLKRVLLTCDETNVASAKIIEKHGGVLENTLEKEDGRPAKRRYWIRL